ncbi:MAG: phosphatase PAP2 family protein [Ferruginibacter sp.]|nr:phosphatase PAP2 family protein [Ferruginibacter sp.]
MTRRIKFRIKKVWEAVALVSLELVLVFIAFVISLSVLIVVIREIFYNKDFSVDEQVFEYMQHHVTDTNTAIMQGASFMGSRLVLVPAWLLLVVVFYFIEKNKWYVIKVITISLSTLLLMLGLKYFFNRPRPLIPLLKQVPGLSFPSGHAFMSFVFYGMLVYIVYIEVKSKWVKAFLFFLLTVITFSIGLSRVYLRVHYASDVIAGFCFGLLSLIILLWLLRRIEKYNEKVIAPSVNTTQAEHKSVL